MKRIYSSAVLTFTICFIVGVFDGGMGRQLLCESGETELLLQHDSGGPHRPDAARSGDVIYIAPGTYTESGQIVVDKNISIIGQGHPVIMTSSDTNGDKTNDGSGDSRDRVRQSEPGERGARRQRPHCFSAIRGVGTARSRTAKSGTSIFRNISASVSGRSATGPSSTTPSAISNAKASWPSFTA